MNQQEHLNDSQIEQYARTVSVVGSEIDGKTDHLEAHLEDCAPCRERVLASVRIRFGLAGDFSVKVPPNLDPPGPDCPDEDALRSFAAGNYPSNNPAKLLNHIARCGRCGPILGMYSEDFSDELTADDKAVLDGMKSSSLDWQKDLAKRLGGNPDDTPLELKRKPFPWRWALVPSALAACAAIAFAVWYQQRETPEKVERLLAQAYTENRQLEMRIPYAKHAEFHQLRGNSSETSYVQLPRPFREATDVIASKLDRDPKNPRWLLVKAQLDILQGLYEPALKSLDKLPASLQPADYHLTRALALFQEGDVDSNPRFYAMAADELSAVLAEMSNDPVALFDRALVYEKLGMLDKASQDWKTFLQVEHDPGWRQEGIQRKQAVDRTLLRQTSEYNFSDPREFNSLSVDQADHYVEQYQDAALRAWLPDTLREPSRDSALALTRLTNLLAERHRDKWLRALMKATSPKQLPAVRVLVEAILANEAGRYAAARRTSRRAANLFKHFGNRPGEIRSLYEEVYADHRSLRASSCLARASTLRSEAAQHEYQWLHVELAIETSICLNYIGDLNKANEFLAVSQGLADSFHFPILLLREIGIGAGIARQQGKCDEAWTASVRGVALYWRGTYPKSRLYQLYMVMGLCAAQVKMWRIAETLHREAISLLDEDHDPVQVAVARLTLVNLLLLQQRYSAADVETKEAQRLFASAQHDPLNDTYHFSTMIDLASSQLHQGNPQLALASLRVSEPLLTSTQGYFISLPFYRLRADAHLSLGDFAEAVNDYRMAIRYADALLQTLHAQADRLRWLEETDRSYRGLVLAYVKHNEPERALQQWEWYRSLSLEDATHSRSGPKRAPPEWTTSKIVTPGPGLRLVYAVFEDGFELWSLSEQGSSSYWVPISRSKLESLARQFADICSSPSSRLEELRARGSDISDLLLRPVALQLNNTELITIELDQTLAAVPMEALPTLSGEYLGAKYSLVYSPGFVAEGLLRQIHPLKDQASVVILRPRDLGLPAGYAFEKDAISDSFPRTRIIFMDRTTLHSQLPLIGGADIAHLVAHGRQDGSGTALVVSANPTYLLRAADFQPAYLQRLQLAVLAACSSGVSSQFGVMDPQSLVHAFLSAGVPNVIASHWNVDSESTARLMSSFYKHLRQGEPAPKALSAARREFISAHPHPYYWAGFSVNGKAN